MKTLEQAFRERATLFALVETQAKGVLSDFCSRKGFLLAGRTKNIDSLRDKLETGRYPDLSSIDDAIAFSVVIDTIDQEEEVRKFIKEVFNVASINSGNTIRDERIFDFDCTRIYCRLVDNLNVGYDGVIFEVQIRTLMQHAWSKITHPHVYKARTYDTRAGRLAAELMAQIEATDRTFSRFNAISKTVKVVARREVSASNSLTAMIDELVADGTIPSEMRPENGRRLGDNIFTSITQHHRGDIAKATAVIKTFLKAQAPNFPRSVSIFQLAIVALHDARLLDHGTTKRPRRYYITDNLVSLFPNAASIPNQIGID